MIQILIFYLLANNTNIYYQCSKKKKKLYLIHQIHVKHLWDRRYTYRKKYKFMIKKTEYI